ncbi:hypothetical protein M2366_002349 [Aeromonas sp. BIGb0405]|uniref:hypothetical protein n=1 Tax=Aeromonas sp. BIGb0405 TaxID=2940592 RepID=UPI0021683F38|nr:hypothetical protein [Aeromonas sp. BIGb0405]MCS3456263.1 hypothetical protein [Aeromonas sp. BIGb0405]
MKALWLVAISILLLSGCDEQPPQLHKWAADYHNEFTGGDNYQFVMTNPPEGQRALVTFLADYFQQHPLEPIEYGAIIYRESSDTPINGDVPKAGMFDQTMRGKAKVTVDINEYVIASVSRLDDIGKKGGVRIFFSSDYRETCQELKYNAVDIVPGQPLPATCN